MPEKINKNEAQEPLAVVQTKGVIDAKALATMQEQGDMNGIQKNIDSFKKGALSKDTSEKMINESNYSKCALYNFDKFKGMTAQGMAESIISSKNGAFAVLGLPEDIKNIKDKVADLEGRIDSFKTKGYKENDKEIIELETQKVPLVEEVAKMETVAQNIDKQKLLELCISMPNKLNPERFAFFTTGPDAVVTPSALIGRTIEAKTYSDGYLSSFFAQAPDGSLDASLVKTLKDAGKEDIAKQYEKKFAQ